MVISIMGSGPSEPRARRHVRNRSLHGLRGVYWVYPRVLWHMYSIRGFTLFMLVFLLCCWPASASLCTLTFPSALLFCYFVLCFDFSLVCVSLSACACRSRWGPCMSHEALSGHTCKPSFLPTKGEVVKLAPTTFDRCGRWFESQCRHTLSVLGGFG